MITKNIHIEFRAPRNKSEKSYFGLTWSNNEKADVFINLRKNKKSSDMVDTFFHEMAHVFFAFHKTNRKMTEAEEEKLAKQLGRVCLGVIR